MIDAGHGGTDPGAVSKDKKTYEKTLTLDISRRLSSLITESCPGVKVIQTRPSDAFVSLNERATKANNADADLFISIHINSTQGTLPNGFSVHVLGQSSHKDRDLFAYNMDVCRRENSVMLLEDDYSTKYQGFDPSDPESFIFMQLMQNAYLEQSLSFAQTVADHLSKGPIKANRGIWQNPFYVLWKTSMPAVLVELGFISNSSDLDILRNPGERQKIAEALFDSFVEYKTTYDASINVGTRNSQPEAQSVQPAVSLPSAANAPSSAPSTAESASAEPAASAASATSAASQEKLYGTQIFAGRTKLDPKDRQFLGYEPKIVRFGEIYKYVIGVSASEKEARESYEQIRIKYPNSFFVIISDSVYPFAQACESKK